jgi:SAM-dependent methyltransferase
VPPMASTAPAMPAPANAPSPQEVEAFAGRVLTDLASTMVALQAGLGDKHGLFKDLAACGPQTPAQIAACTRTDERYVREWASCLASAGYLVHDPARGTFALPAAHVPVLAEEGGAAFLGGLLQQVGALADRYYAVAKVFREGGGVPAESFHADLWEGELRGNDMWHNNLLVQDWLPRVPAVQAALQRGVQVADLGSGPGRALVRMAQAFPRSRFTGYEIVPGNVEHSRTLAKQEGVADRVRIVQHDLTAGIPGQYDVVTAFDIAHDVQDPPKLFQDARKALKPGGRFLLLEIASPDRLEDADKLFGPLMYGASSFFCMTISLARGGQGYGICGLPEGKVRELAKAAGFAEVRLVPEAGAPLNKLYEIVA